MTPFTKLIWLRNEHQDLFNQAKWFVGIKEYVIYKLFGELKEDYSIANATGMFNIFNMDWDQQALDLAGVTRDQLPELVDTTATVSGMNADYAKVIGIDPNTPFVMGASDGHLLTLASMPLIPGLSL